jgi:transposase
MLREANWFKKVIIKCGRTDLRRGISGLMSVIRLEYGLDPVEEGTLFLFCGNKRNCIKGICFDQLSADFCYPHISYPDSR